MHIFCGDIGGTNSRLLVADVDDTGIRTIFEKHYPSRRFAQFDEVLDVFLREVDAVPEAACFAIAGPVKKGEARVTNLPWRLHETALQEKYSIARVALINDFSAVAHGVSVLPDSDFRVIQQGRPEPDAPAIILGAGTGLGVAQRVSHQGHRWVMPSQGGHIGFSPGNAVQRDMLQWLAQQQAHVSNEDVLSGKGLVNLYRYFAVTAGRLDSDRVQQTLAREDAPAAISQSAISGDDDMAVSALREFISIYGAVAGDLALLALAYGGVYLAGGIAARLADQLCSDFFLAACHNKGPMAELMPQFPIRIIMNERVGLLGAAAYAARSV